MNSQADPLVSFLPLILLITTWAIGVGMLASTKGYNVVKWVALTLIPPVSFLAICYMVGAPDRRLERKTDEALAQLQS